MPRDDIDRLVDGYVRGGLSRRQFITRALALGLSAASITTLLQACGPGQQSAPGASASQARQASELSVLGWGGSYGDSLDKWVNKPFESENKVKILFQQQQQASQSLAKVQTEANNPTVDVWLTTTSFPLQLAKAGMIQELPADKVPNIKDLVPYAVQNYQGKAYGAGIHLGLIVIMVDNQRIKQFIPDYNINMLKSWTFLYRPELKNQYSTSGFGGLHGASKIVLTIPYGGSEFDKDEEKVFAAFKRLAPNIHAIPAGIGFAQLFLSKEIVAASGTTTDAQQAIKAGAPLDIGVPVDPLLPFLDYVVAIKNGPAGGDLALKYVNKMLDPKVAAPYVSDIAQFSPNSKAVQPTMQGIPPVTAEQFKTGWVMDYEANIANFDRWNERWNKEIVPLIGK